MECYPLAFPFISKAIARLARDPLENGPSLLVDAQFFRHEEDDHFRLDSLLFTCGESHRLRTL